MVKKPIAPGGDNGPNTIFKATYSGVPVYEMICRNVAVMRRKSDAYLNATQILKVAGFDKPQRTRVLEREVQKGEHEKVQGGYGKYQGTWIPIERGLALSKQYGVEDLLRPIIDYVPTSVSPPPAPKHAVAPPTKVKKEKDGKPKDGTPVKTGPTSAAALAARAQLAAQQTQAQSSAKKKHAMDSTPDPADTTRSFGDSSSEPAVDDDASSSSRTPSPIASPTTGTGIGGAGTRGSSLMDVSMDSGPMSSARKRPAAEMMMDDTGDYLARARGRSAVHTPEPMIPHQPGMMSMNGLEPMGPEGYTDVILNYFISETTQIPSILVSPPADFDANARIDEDGHTALHWACAMGRVRVVKLLLTAGASIFVANNAEQTPLMRSVMFSNNYDVRKFSELYELLHRSTLNIDRNNRTVFHHIANLALTKGKTHAARYYMETILSRLADFPQELADVINFQDEDGETALTLAARARSRRLVKSLLDHGADPKIKNRDLKSAEDYILEDERFRSSPVAPGRSGQGQGINASAGVPPARSPMAHQLFSSEAARLAGGSCLADITAHMQSLAKSFDAELAAKERDILQAKALLTGIHAEITETSRTVAQLEQQAGAGSGSGPAMATGDASAVSAEGGSTREVVQLEHELRAALDRRLRAGWEDWRAGEAEREGRWFALDELARGGLGEAGAGAGVECDLRDLQARFEVAGDVAAAERELRWEIEERRKRRKGLVGEYVRALAEAGTGDKIAQYRRLIAAGSGGSVEVGEMDAMMTRLLETLENESNDVGAPDEADGMQWVVGV